MAKKNKVSYLEILKDGIITKNPIFIQLLGMCPTLAVTTTVANGIGMGLSATFVLICSNFFISVLRKFIPNKIRIASYIVIIAGFVSTVEMIINAWLPELSKSLGLFIPLIVVNCIILARAEAFASKNSPLPSAVDGLASGIGFTLALTIISAIRELLGNGTILGANIMGENFSPALIIILPAGGFLVLGFLIALVQYIMSKLEGRSK
ncbi:MAG: electron transport complex subunit E [Clostridia bacterium]|nr:electron transport complex subunit E [Clostridia bacterium]